MCEPWDADVPGDLEAIQTRLADLLRHVRDDADARRTPSVDMVRERHRVVHAGLTLPEPYYAGEVRDSDPRFPCLTGYEVRIGALYGVPSPDVPDALDAFENGLVAATSRLDAVIAPGTRPADRAQVHAALELSAIAHGEWVRIHPFANGNGRTARLLANWCLLRYGLPPIVRVRPRPDQDAYASAARASMLGNHEPMTRLLWRYLGRFPG